MTISASTLAEIINETPLLRNLFCNWELYIDIGIQLMTNGLAL